MEKKNVQNKYRVVFCFSLLAVFCLVSLLSACSSDHQNLELEKFSQPLNINLTKEKVTNFSLIKQRGFITCGVGTDVVGFSFLNESGEWSGLDIDFCRAVAAALFGNSHAVKFIPLSTTDRFIALSSGKVDLLSRNSSWTASRDNALGISFVGVMYYDGQGFLVKQASKIKKPSQLNGKTICILEGTTAEENLADYFATERLNYNLLIFKTQQEMLDSFELGRCDALSSDQSRLYSLRMRLSDPLSVYLLPEVISKELLGPAVRNDDDAWFKLVRWVLHAIVYAEEIGVNSKNARVLKVQGNHLQKRFLGTGSDLGSKMGLTEDWAFQTVIQVGNYKEIFERNFGSAAKLGLLRGKNSLWKDGGLLYAPPVR